MTKWEYKHYRINFEWGVMAPGVKWDKQQAYWEKTNEFGKQGWDMIGSSVISGLHNNTLHVILHFKRPIE